MLEKENPNIDKSKRLFNHSVAIGITSFFVYPFFKILQKKNQDENQIIINKDKFNYSDIFINNDIIALKNNETFLILKNKCTHLGCKIKLLNQDLICPCHGSKYNKNGEPIKGPAIEKLTELTFIENEKSIIINLNG